MNGTTVEHKSALLLASKAI